MGYTLIGEDVIPAVTGGVFGFARTLTVSDTLLTSPAFVLVSYIIEQMIGDMTDPVDDSDWPLYVSYTSDTSDVKTDLGVMYDTTPVKDGRFMEGPVQQHYGIQLKIRSKDHIVGITKAEEISSVLDAVVNETITVGVYEYQIYNISRGTVISLGSEPNTKNRRLFTVNFLVSMKRIIS